MGLSVRHVTTRRMAGAAVRTRRTPENTGTRTRESVSPLRVERSKSPRGASPYDERPSPFEVAGVS